MSLTCQSFRGFDSNGNGFCVHFRSTPQLSLHCPQMSRSHQITWLLPISIHCRSTNCICSWHVVDRFCNYIGVESMGIVSVVKIVYTFIIMTLRKWWHEQNGRVGRKQKQSELPMKVKTITSVLLGCTSLLIPQAKAYSQVTMLPAIHGQNNITSHCTLDMMASKVS